jgi:hypothetical protein
VHFALNVKAAEIAPAKQGYLRFALHPQINLIINLIGL